MRRTMFILALVATCGCSSWADFNWLNLTNNRITYASGGTNYLPGNVLDSNGSCFVQLIYAGANGTNDQAVNSGTGTTNDDVVAATSWMGKNPSSLAGICNAGTFFGGVTNGLYFVRVWSAPASNYTNGLVPTSPTNFYGDSAFFTNSCPSCPILDEIEFDFGGASGFATALSPGITDTDGNGLPDWWESQYFGSPTGTDASADADGDGQNNFEEYVAGTDPTNSSSLFEVVVFGGAPSSNTVVQWSSVAGKTYDLMRGTNVVSGFAPLATGIAATPPLNSYTDTTSGAQTYFYGIRVK